jgi:hypothetical protein
MHWDRHNEKNQVTQVQIKKLGTLAYPKNNPNHKRALQYMNKFPELSSARNNNVNTGLEQRGNETEVKEQNKNDFEERQADSEKGDKFV